MAPKKADGASNKPNGDTYRSPLYQVIPAYQGPGDADPTQFIFFLPPTEAKSQGFSSIWGTSFAVVIADVYGPQSTNGSSPPPGGDIVLSWTAWPNLTAQIPVYVWNTDAQSRQNLATAFAALLSQLEAMEDNGQLSNELSRNKGNRQKVQHFIR